MAQWLVQWYLAKLRANVFIDFNYQSNSNMMNVRFNEICTMYLLTLHNPVVRAAKGYTGLAMYNEESCQ